MPSRKMKKIHSKAQETAKDAVLLHRLADQALKKAHQHRVNIPELWTGVKTLIRLVKAWVSREYKAIPWKSMIAAIAALLYFLDPFDLIPDFLPLGFLDDVFVLTNVLALIKSDLDDFLVWEKKKK